MLSHALLGETDDWDTAEVEGAPANDSLRKTINVPHVYLVFKGNGKVHSDFYVLIGPKHAYEQ